MKIKIPELSIIICVKDAYQYFIRCIDSLYKIKDLDGYEVICINDGSTDFQIIEYLNSLPSIKVLHNKESLGFTKSCNIAAEQALGKYILMLNSDTVLIELKSFRFMIDCFKKKNIGVVGAKLLLGNNTIQHAGLIFDRGQMNFIHRYYGVDRNDPRVCVSEVVPVVTGACFMTAKKLWEEMGGWDDIYSPGYFEDTDFCLSIKEKGYSTYYCADAILRHYQEKSFG